MTLAFALIVIFLAAYFGTSAFRSWGLGRGVVDVPNERSSHVTPTPRGAGLIFVLICLLSYAILAAYFQTLPWIYLLTAGLVAGISWLDDLHSIPSAWRLAVHFLSAATLVLVTGGSNGLDGAKLVASGGAVLWIVWMINAYNFMDGIDGIAGSQAVVAGISWAVFTAMTGEGQMSVYASIVAVSVLAFLLHNWEPAKIFMGDVGSAFLGFTLASFPFLRANVTDGLHSVYATAGLIFLWFFFFDTVVTLLKRLVRRERVWEAHRSHLYQRMVIAGWRHSRVTIIYGMFAAVLSTIYIISIQQSDPAVYFWNAAVLIVLASLSVILVIVSLRSVTQQ
jgi:UDP-N-acetylmuramyl pentapeptide phosphotransferase/UDP-N-acetylglucosamine-1-phosphate transferase